MKKTTEDKKELKKEMENLKKESNRYPGNEKILKANKKKKKNKEKPLQKKMWKTESEDLKTKYIVKEKTEDS
jgi:hypothetical protein